MQLGHKQLSIQVQVFFLRELFVENDTLQWLDWSELNAVLFAKQTSQMKSKFDASSEPQSLSPNELLAFEAEYAEVKKELSSLNEETRRNQ